MKPVFLDGLLYVLIAVFIFEQEFLSSDEAYKYVSPYVIFWSKFIIGTSAAATQALKMFRSTSYSDHLKNQADNKQKQIEQQTNNEKTPPSV